MRFILAAILLVAQLPAQAPTDAKPYIGNWNAMWEGRPFMHLAIRNTNPLTGHIKTGDISVNGAGQLISVQEGENDEYDLFDIRIADGKLRFRTRGEDGELALYEMKLTPNGKATLTIIVEGVAIQPLVLTRPRA